MGLAIFAWLLGADGAIFGGAAYGFPQDISVADEAIFDSRRGFKYSVFSLFLYIPFVC